MVLVAVHFTNEQEREEAMEDLRALDTVVKMEHVGHEEAPPKMEGRIRGYHGHYAHSPDAETAESVALLAAEFLDGRSATGVCQIHTTGVDMTQASFGEAAEVAERHHDWCLLCAMPADVDDDLEDVWEVNEA